jgi:hypothetical protein
VLTRGSVATCLLRSPKQTERLHACLLQFREACDGTPQPDATALVALLRKV